MMINKFSRPVFQGRVCPALFLEASRPNYATFGVNIGRSSCDPTHVLDFQQVALFRNYMESNATEVSIFALFHPTVKIRGGIGEMSESFFVFDL